MSNNLTMLIYLMMIILSIIFSLITPHPIIMLIMIILYAICVSLFISIYSYQTLYSIIVLLIMITGMFVIFLYFTALIANNKTTTSFTLSPLLNSFLINLMILFLIMNKNSNKKFMHTTCHMETSNKWMNAPKISSINFMFIYPNIYPTIMCMLFLLISLFMIIKISSTKSAPLRKIKSN